MATKNAGVVAPRDCSLSVRQAIQQLSTKVAGLESTPTFAGLTVSSLTLVNTVTEFSTDGTLGGNSDSALPTEKAVKTYIDVGIGAGGHDHDTDTLKFDGINSDGGAFSFTTTGTVTFNQSIAAANYAASNLLTACATNAGALDFSAASKTLTVEDDATVSQDYSSDASPTFAGLNFTTDAATVLFNWTATNSYGQIGFRQGSIYIGFIGSYGTAYGSSQQGKIIITSALDNDGGILFRTKTTTYQDRVMIANNGNVGFGTMTPSERIDLSSGNLITTGTINASSGEVLIEDNATVEPTNKDDGYIGVAIVGGQPRIYFTVDSDMYYVEGSASAAVESGNPIGLLLVLTYA